MNAVIIHLTKQKMKIIPNRKSQCCLKKIFLIGENFRTELMVKLFQEPI